jgi:glycerol-3-phosphate cytidylyltransferase
MGEETMSRIGFTCSAFDLFHSGHVAMLKEASNHCDYLIVGLQTDPTLDRPEKNSPIQSVFERYVQLEGCKYIDEIIPYATEQDLMDIFLTYKIDVRFIGEEYRTQEFTGKELCLNKNIEIYYNSRQHSFSTSELRKRIVHIEHLSEAKCSKVPGRDEKVLDKKEQKEYNEI